MNLEKARKPLTVLAVLVSATGLALLVDGRKVLIEICVVALALTVFFVWAWIRAYQNFWKIQRVMAAFFLWSATSAVFAFRMLHLESLYLIIFLGALVAIFVGLLWSPVRFLGALITFEWFVIFLFAPASYAVLGALTTDRKSVV